MSRSPSHRSVRALLGRGLSSLCRLLSPAERPGRAARRRPARLGLEVLEDRTLPAISLTSVPVSAVEGKPFSGAVATFTEPGGALANFSATINYGDGTAAVTVTSTAGPNGQIVADPTVSGQFDVQGNHTFPEEGTFNVAVAVSDSATSATATTGSYTLADLVTDSPTFLATLPLPPAAHTDPNLVNPWGIVASPAGSPFWVADNGTGKSTLYDGSGNPQALVVTIPASANPGATSPSPPTGIVFNGSTTDFLVSGAGTAAHFIFATEDGTIAAWNTGTTAVLKVDNTNFTTGPVFKGLAIGTNGTGSFLYATDFRTGTIDVFDTNFHKVTLGSGGFGTFTDPTTGTGALPAGFAPFGIRNINNQLYVTYALQDTAKHDDVAGAGNGFVDVFDLNGNFVKRLASGGTLDSPWGLALAPSSFGAFGGALLVGNFGDGRINAFNPNTGTFLGQLADASNAPITIPGLWGLSFGNNGSAGSAGTLFFTAGIGGEMHGLFGSLTAVNGATATVADAGLVAGTQPIVAPTAGVAFSGAVATFNDLDPNGTATDYTATITWGDGHTSTGTVTANSSGGFTVSGSNTYAAVGSFDISVVVKDVGGSTVTVANSATVRPVPAIVYVNPSFTGAAGTDPDGAGPATAIGYDAFPTIQQGLNAVATGGKVVVEAGTYHEADTISRTVVVQGAGVGSATLSGQGVSRGVAGLNVTASGAVAISGLTVSGFTAGLLAGSATPYVSLLDVHFTGNTFGSFIGGVNTVLITGGAGNDTIFANPIGVDRQGDDPVFYQNVRALTVDGGGGVNQLLVFLNDTNVATTTWVTAFGIARAGGGIAPFLLFYTDTGGTFGGGVDVFLGAGSETAVVQSQLPGTPTSVIGTGGNDTFIVGVTTASLYLNLLLVGGSGTNTLMVFDNSGGATAANFETPQNDGDFVVAYPGGVVSQIYYLNMEQVLSNVVFVTIPTTLT